jgi:hypothetical protein
VCTACARACPESSRRASRVQVWKAGTVGVGGVVGDGGRGVEVGVSVGVAAGGAVGEGEVSTSVGARGRGVALGTGSAVSVEVSEATGRAGSATGVGLSCVGAQLDRGVAKSAASNVRLNSFNFMCLSFLSLPDMSFLRQAQDRSERPKGAKNLVAGWLFAFVTTRFFALRAQNDIL